MKRIFELTILLLLTNISYSQTYNNLITYSDKIDNRSLDFTYSDSFVYISGAHFCLHDSLDNVRVNCNSILKFAQNDILASVAIDSFASNGKNSIITHDQNIYFSGTTIPILEGRPNIIERYDESLNKTFRKIINPFSNGVINNNGLIRNGDFYYSFGNIVDTNMSFAHIQKLDTSFNVVWEKKYNRSIFSNTCHDLQPTPDGNLMYVNDFFDNFGAGGDNGHQLMKIDLDGNKVDSLEFDFSTSSNNIIPSLLVSESGHVYFTTLNNPEPISNLPSHGHINKYSPDLNTLEWSVQLPFNNRINERRYRVYDLHEAQNGDILACGETFDGSQSIFTDQVNKTWNGFFIRISPDGEIKNLRVYKTLHNNPLLVPEDYGVYRESALFQIHEMPDGRIILGGTANYTPWQNGVIYPSGEIRSWIWMMTVNPNGCLDGEECQEVIIINGENQPWDPIFTLGTKWTYEYFPDPINPNHIIHSYITYEVTDTITENDTIVYIITNNRGLQEERMIQGDNEIWFWDNNLDDWQLTYDFDANNSYDTQFGSPGFITNTTAVVDTTEIFTFGERGVITLKKISVADNGTLEEPLKIDILERCGNLTGGLRLGLGLNLFDPFYQIGNIRCFEQDTFFFNFDSPPNSTIACDSVWTEILNSTSSDDQPVLNIYPNPTSNQIQIEGLEKDEFYSLHSITGKLIDSGYTKNQVININEKGIYILNIRIDQLWYRKKIIRL